MDGYGAYAEQLRNAVASQAVQQRQVMDKFQGKLAETERVKNLIDTASESVGAVFTTPLIQKGVKKIGEKVAGKVVEKIENRLRPKPEEPEATPEEPAQAARTEAQNDLGGAGETDFVETGTELTDLSPPTMEEALAEIRARPPPQGTTQEDLPEGAGEIQGEISRPMGAGEGSTETANAAGEAEQAASGAVEDAVEGATSTAADAVTGAAEAASATATAAEVGIDAALLADPLTAIFGAILGIGIAAAGIGGADTIKNPSVPKTPQIANVSTQFGIGNNGS
ncbi:MAG: hypothetical protein ACR2M9_03985 [Cyanophyceae cyanobacterium]